MKNKKQTAMDMDALAPQIQNPVSPQFPGGQRYLSVLVLQVLIFGLFMAVLQTSQAQQLSANQLAGKKLYLQRCSVCHMPAPSQLHDPELPTYGPILEGYIKDAATESRARAAIHDGTMRMPGFRYGLSAADIDNIVAYLKIFKLSDFIRPGEDVAGGPDVIIPITGQGSDRPAEDPTD